MLMPMSSNNNCLRLEAVSNFSDTFTLGVVGSRQFFKFVNSDEPEHKFVRLWDGVQAARRRRDELGPARVNTCKRIGEGSELVPGDGMNSDHGKLPGFGRGPSSSQELG